MCQADRMEHQQADRTGHQQEAATMARTVKRARNALIESVRASLQRADGPTLRSAHTQVFECLDPEGTRLTTLAERARISHQAMGEMVDDLVRQGLLERVPDQVDRRARLIRPTTLGRAELARAAAQLQRIRQRWEDRLQGTTVADVLTALDALIGVCEEPDRDERPA